MNVLRPSVIMGALVVTDLSNMTLKSLLLAPGVMHILVSVKVSTPLVLAISLRKCI